MPISLSSLYTNPEPDNCPVFDCALEIYSLDTFGACTTVAACGASIGEVSGQVSITTTVVQTTSFRA